MYMYIYICICICIAELLCCTTEINIANQLYFNKIKKKSEWSIQWETMTVQVYLDTQWSYKTSFPISTTIPISPLIPSGHRTMS